MKLLVPKAHAWGAVYILQSITLHYSLWKFHNVGTDNREGSHRVYVGRQTSNGCRIVACHKSTTFLFYSSLSLLFFFQKLLDIYK